MMDISEEQKTGNLQFFSRFQSFTIILLSVFDMLLWNDIENFEYFVKMRNSVQHSGTRGIWVIKILVLNSPASTGGIGRRQI